MLIYIQQFHWKNYSTFSVPNHTDYSFMLSKMSNVSYNIELFLFVIFLLICILISEVQLNLVFHPPKVYLNYLSTLMNSTNFFFMGLHRICDPELTISQLALTKCSLTAISIYSHSHCWVTVVAVISGSFEYGRVHLQWMLRCIQVQLFPRLFQFLILHF